MRVLTNESTVVPGRLMKLMVNNKKITYDTFV